MDHREPNREPKLRSSYGDCFSQAPWARRGLHFLRLGQNRYIGAVSVGFGPDGKRLRRKVSGKTTQEVRDKLRELHADLNAGLPPSAGYTLQAAVEEWLEHGLSG